MFQLSGKVLITGGCGFLARGIYRRARRESWDVQFTAISRTDRSIALLNARYPEVRTYRLDVAAPEARDLLAPIMRGHDLVVHAAAVKYVDLAEFAAIDTVRHNVEGSTNVMLSAIAAGVAQVVGISTDKACEPVNVYGLTKAIMERTFMEADAFAQPATRFAVVRYGNVVGSTGSVLTLFQRQMANTGRVRITDPGMTRFWMSVDDAVDTILTAIRFDQWGRLLIPSMAGCSLMQVAHRVVNDTGLIDVVGKRAGEKVHESLVGAAELPRTCRLVDVASTAHTVPPAYYVMSRPGVELPVHLAHPVTSEDPPGGNVPVDWLEQTIADAGTV